MKPKTIVLKPVTGWAVRVWRANGDWFFAIGVQGTITPVWEDRQYAERCARALLESGFKARVVQVHYAHPVALPPAKKLKRCKA